MRMQTAFKGIKMAANPLMFGDWIIGWLTFDLKCVTCKKYLSDYMKYRPAAGQFADVAIFYYESQQSITYCIQHALFTSDTKSSISFQFGRG